MKVAILNIKTPYPQMAQIEQIFNAFSYLLNISGMMHTVPKVSSKNRVIVQTFGTFPRFIEMIRFFCVIREICGWTKTIMRITVMKERKNRQPSSAHCHSERGR